jgi:hypothetical protein
LDSLRASAQERPLVLSLEAPPGSGCSTQEELEELALSHVEPRPYAQVEARHVHVRIAVSHARDADAAREGRAAQTEIWVATLSMRDAQGTLLGERVLDSASASCVELEHALVIVLSTLVGFSAPAQSETLENAAEQGPAHLAENGRAPSESETKEPSDMRRPKASVVAATTPSGGRALRVAGVASGLFSTGLLPATGFGLGAGTVLAWHALSLGAAALAFPHAVKDLGAGAEASFFALLGRAQLCGQVYEKGPFALGLCVGFRAGALFSRTRGLAHNVATRVPSADVEFSARASVRLTERARAYVGLGALLPLARARFVFDESDAEQRTYHQVLPGFFVELGVLLGARS